MKTAFLTSVAGLFAALLVKILVVVGAPSRPTGGTGAADIVSALNALRETSASELQQLRSAIVGDGSSSVVTQLRAFRDEAGTGRAEILKGLNDVADALAESATKALIAALENAIKDFNQRITEQFGSNFAQLNTGVGQLLEWQGRYREQLAEMIGQFERSAAASTDAAGAMRQIASESASVVQVAASLNQITLELSRIRADVEARLGAFADMATKAGEAMPRIEANMAALTDGLEREVRKAVEASASVVEQQRVQAAALIEQTSRFRQDAQQIVAESAARLKEVMDAFGQQSAQTIGDVAQRIEQAQRAEWERLRTSLTGASQQTTDQINKNFSELDKAMQQELTKALEALGGRLAAVTRAFADDFGRAITELRRAARVAGE